MEQETVRFDDLTNEDKQCLSFHSETNSYKTKEGKTVKFPPVTPWFNDVPAVETWTQAQKDAVAEHERLKQEYYRMDG